MADGIYIADVIKRGLVCILSDPKFGFSSVCIVKFTGGSGDGVMNMFGRTSLTFSTGIYNQNPE